MSAFEFFGGVPHTITYDNTRVAVSFLLGKKERKLTTAFCQLKSHYLNHRFCNVARANEKGVVEGLVKFTRLNFFVPVPQMRDFDELNAYLRKRCTEDQQRRLRGQAGTKAQLLEEDRKAFVPLPASAFEACREVSTTASSLSLVRFDGIRVLRLLEKHLPAQLRGAIEQALRVGAITRHAIAQFLLPREDWRRTTFTLDSHPHLRHVRVAIGDVHAYAQLGRCAMSKDQSTLLLEHHLKALKLPTSCATTQAWPPCAASKAAMIPNTSFA